MTSNLKKFINLLCFKLDISFKNKDVELILNLLLELDDKETLRELRQNTQYLVLLVRFYNEENKKEEEQIE